MDEKGFYLHLSLPLMGYLTQFDEEIVNEL